MQKIGIFYKVLYKLQYISVDLWIYSIALRLIFIWFDLII